ncbi:MAG: hypothetical protein GQ544_05415, partial [Candidatus Aminicenantes bacterium]|nr:hypothetical protein [Candidatus Aminicenantes bacterium]
MKNNYKFWIALSFLAIFAAGIVSGVILERHLLDQKPGREHRTSRMGPRDSSREGGNRFLDRMAEELDLTAEQKQQMQDLFKNNEERIKQLHSDMADQLRALRTQFMEEIKSVLTEEQVKKFDAMIEAYHTRRKAQ